MGGKRFSLIFLPPDCVTISLFLIGQAGVYKVKANMISEPDGTEDVKEAIVVVSTALSGLSLFEPENCTYLDESVALEASVDEGFNVTLTWITSKYGERNYVFAKMLQTSGRGRGQQDDSKYIGNAGSEMLS
ncbi:hypothetical protein TNCV_5033031 [Trichonephila clavipes]|nr:hypothetical protein TNCV_5033031 [Trichonephila clavipes]